MRVSKFEIRNRKVGGGEGIRTPDPRVANAVLCQLSYAPDKQSESQIPNSRFKKILSMNADPRYLPEYQEASEEARKLLDEMD